MATTRPVSLDKITAARQFLAAIDLMVVSGLTAAAAAAFLNRRLALLGVGAPTAEAIAAARAWTSRTRLVPTRDLVVGGRVTSHYAYPETFTVAHVSDATITFATDVGGAFGSQSVEFDEPRTGAVLLEVPC